MKRRETFATSPPRIRSGTLSIYAEEKPLGANLDRVQIIEGWIDVKGSLHETIDDVARADGSESGRNSDLPSIGNTVDLETTRYANAIGAPRSISGWTEPICGDFRWQRSAQV